jgi:hypothetical protein
MACADRFGTSYVPVYLFCARQRKKDTQKKKSTALPKAETPTT